MNLNLKTVLLVVILFLTANLFSQEMPKSAPNNASERPYPKWKVDDYQYFINKETYLCTSQAIREKYIQAILKLQKQEVINYAESIKKIYNDSVYKMIIDSTSILASMEKKCTENLQKKIEYANEWIVYLKALKEQEETEVAAVEQARIDKETKDAIERQARAKEQEKAAKLEEEYYIQLPKSIEYKKWKAKYLAMIKSADSNILVINNLEKKYSFRNKFGRRIWDPNALSKQDRITYNKNYNAIKNKIDAVEEYQKTGLNESYFDFYLNAAIYDHDETGKGYEEHYLFQYYHEHESY